MRYSQKRETCDGEYCAVGSAVRLRAECSCYCRKSLLLETKEFSYITLNDGLKVFQRHWFLRVSECSSFVVLP